MPDGMDRAEWRSVQEALESLLPYYERVNLVNTFARLPVWRAWVARSARPDDVVVEVGTGPGGFARQLGARRVYCLDPSSAMLSHARGRLESARYGFLSGLAEQMPIRTGSVDKVYCSFSFRDFFDKPAAVREFARVLRPGGELHVLEAARPPPGLRRAFMDSWLRIGTRAVVSVLVPREVRRRWREPPFDAFVRTYAAMAAPEAYADLLRHSGFEAVRVEYVSMRSVFRLQGARARTT